MLSRLHAVGDISPAVFGMVGLAVIAALFLFVLLTESDRHDLGVCRYSECDDDAQVRWHGTPVCKLHKEALDDTE